MGSHLMNDHSSRSHSMLTVYIDIESVSTSPSLFLLGRSLILKIKSGKPADGVWAQGSDNRLPSPKRI